LNFEDKLWTSKLLSHPKFNELEKIFWIAEGFFMYFDECEVEHLLSDVSSLSPSGTLLCYLSFSDYQAVIWWPTLSISNSCSARATLLAISLGLMPPRNCFEDATGRVIALSQVLSVVFIILSGESN
jgi:hypothetical protein